MFNKFKNAIRKVGVRLGLIEDIKSLEQHKKKITVDEDAMARIAKNKQIYSGYYKDWHDIHYTNSAREIKSRTMLGLDMGKLIPEKMASLVFNEKCIIDISNIKDKTTTNEAGEKVTGIAQDFIDMTFRKNKFYRNFQRYIEYMFATGGMAIKVYFANGEVRLSYASADTFIPLSYDQENIDEALFINEERKDKYIYTLLEWHEWEDENYVITNELYQTENEGELGVNVPLATLYEDLEERAVIKGLSRPLFVYIKPNIANNKDMNSPLGISLFENAYNNLYSVDYLHDYFIHEFKMGKRRISVDRAMLNPYPDMNGTERTMFDSDETVYVAIAGEDEPVKDLTVGLRSTEIIEAINAQLDILAFKVGMNPGTFRFDGGGLKTATEVVSQNSETYRTKNSHEVLIEAGIKDLIQTILEFGQLYGLYPKGNENLEIEIGIDFDDSIAQDRQENYNFYAGAVGAKMMPKLEGIMRAFKIPEDKALEWIAQIEEQDKREASSFMEDFNADPDGLK